MNLCRARAQQKLAFYNKTKELIIVHFPGKICDMQSIRKICNKYNLFLIEDCAHAIETKLDNKNAGTFGDFGCFSFYVTKNLSTGEGGMITTNKLFLKNNILTYRNHGIHKTITPKKNNWSYDVIDHSFNFRLSDIQAALGYSQLKKIDKFIFKRKKISEIYNSELKNHNFLNIKNNIVKETLSSWHLYILNINFKKLKIKKETLIQKLYKKKKVVQIHYIPSFFYKKFRYLNNKRNYPGANNFFKNCISLPIYPNLKNAEIKKIIKVLKRILTENVR